MCLSCFYSTPIQHDSLKCVWYLIKENSCQSFIFEVIGRLDQLLYIFLCGIRDFKKRSYGIGFANKKKPPGRKHCLGNIHGMEKLTIGFIVCRTQNLLNSTLFQSFKSHSKLNVQLVPNYVKKYLAFPCVWQLIVI